MKNTEIVRLLYNNPTKTERTCTICNEVKGTMLGFKLSLKSV
ncbi:hypothetical protein L916_11768 [Phytophthora nicotianae]|uniref:BED-type domain-containing protein n=1 Tax=Phytophthora nicotianae TaxID=4792 RepID=W2IQ40_PHYNI|nr:hypothetical protein L916_11768 [Phytophthora nicotianae]